MAEPALRLMSSTEFLAWERQQPGRHEFDRGTVTAMVGASLAHNLIVGNLRRALDDALRRGPCRVFAESAKVIADAGLFYPDVAVTCAAVDLGADVVPEPAALMEVLSDSTAADDRGRKWVRYQTLVSLRHYLLVSQSEALVEVYTRADAGWAYVAVRGVSGVARLPALDCSLNLSAIYDRVPLAA